jgi:hypothetical protein
LGVFLIEVQLNKKEKLTPIKPRKINECLIV